MVAAEDNEQIGLILGSGGVLLLTLFAGPLMRRFGLDFVPGSAVAITLGMILGGLLEAIADDDTLSSQEFDSGLFTLVLLPVIIFEAAYNCNSYYVFLMVKPILVFAFWGTLLTFFVVWPASTAFLSSGEAAMFAGLISAVDPVATLSVLSELRVDPKLEALIAGESVLNDAIAIALYRAAKEFDGDDAGESIAEHVGLFILLVISSVLIGFVTGVGASYVFKVGGMRQRERSEDGDEDGDGDGDATKSTDADVDAKSDHHHYSFLFSEVIAFVAMSYAPFLLAELCEQSGIIASVICGFTMKAFARPNLTPGARKLVEEGLTVMAHAAEIFIFVQVGISASLKLGDDFDFGFVCLAIVLCVLCRAVGIGGLSALHNCRRTPESATYIPLKNQAVAVHAGLRGAIAFAVAFDFPGEKRDLVISTTCLVILFTVFVQGTTTSWLLRKLDVPMKLSAEAPDALRRKEEKMTRKSKFRTALARSASWIGSFVLADGAAQAAGDSNGLTTGAGLSSRDASAAVALTDVSGVEI